MAEPARRCRARHKVYEVVPRSRKDGDRGNTGHLLGRDAECTLPDDGHDIHRFKGLNGLWGYWW